MATLGEILISIQGDATSWQNAVKKSSTALRNFVSDAKKEGINLENFNSHMLAGLMKGNKAVNKSARVYHESLDEIKQGLVNQGKAAKTAEKGITDLATAEIAATVQTQSLAASLKAVSSQLWIMTMGLRQAGLAMTQAFTVPLGALATVSIKTFADWETGTKQLQASTDLSAKGAENFTKDLRELALVMPLTVKELQEIAITAGEAGVSVKNLERYTIAIGKLVTISKELGLKDAAEALVAVSKAFGIAEEDVERVGSVIRKMAKEARGGMDDFVSAILRAIPAATVLNVGFEDLAALLAAIIPVTGTASRAGTQLNTMFDNMSRNLPKLAAQMGITEKSLEDMISKDVVATLKTYIEGLQISADQIDKNQAVLEIFGATGAKAFRALMSQYDEFLLRQEESNEAFKEGIELTKDYEITADTLASQFKIFKNSLQEVTKVIGDDLAPIMRKFLETATQKIMQLAAIWIALPGWVKKLAIGIGVLLAVTGPLILAFNTLLSIFVGFFTTITALINSIKAVGAAFGGLKLAMGLVGKSVLAIIAPFAKFILIAIAITYVIHKIYDALNKLFNITEKIKGALGITAFQERISNAQKKVSDSLEKMGESFKQDGVENMAKAFSAMNLLASKWGDKIMESFLYGFREADFGILDDTMRIVESYYQILEKQGEMTAESIYNSTLEARRAIAKAIYEVKRFGEISVETRKEIESLVGKVRMESLAKEIVAALKVEAIEETIDSINEEIKRRKDALKKETDVIKKAIDERKKIYGDQIDSEEKAIKLLQKRKRVLEKLYKSQLKTYQTVVDNAEDEKTIAKDRLEVIKESNDLFIDNLKEQRDALQENADETRATLDDLRDLRKDEVDMAEGMLDYARMNLESARNQLKKEEALGKDEWDAEWRAAKSRTSQAGDQVDLAYGNYITTKKLYKAEEDILEEKLDLQKDQVKDINKQIKTAEYNAKQQEKIYEEQLKTAEDSLDDAKRALDDFRDIYREQSDLLEEEIDEHRYRVADLKDARDEIIGALEKERDALSEKYNKEIDIFENRLKIAENALDTTRKLLESEQGINEQRLKLEQERLKAAQAMTGGTEFAGIAAGAGYDDLIKQLQEVTQGYEDIGNARSEAFKEEPGEIQEFNLMNWWVEAFKNTPAQLKALFDNIDWEGIKTAWKTTIESIDWSLIGKTILGLLFPPYGIFLLLTEVFNIDWEKVKNDVADFVGKIDWSLVGKTILGLLFPPYGLFLLLTDVFNIDWEKVKNDITNFVSGINWGQIGQTILGAIFAVGDLGTQIYNTISTSLESIGPSLKNAGVWIGEKIASGISSTKDWFKNAANVVYGVTEGLNEKWGEIKEWGKNVGGNIASGIYGAWDNMKDAAKNIVGGISSGLNEMWEQIKGWGKTTGQQLASGIGDAWWQIKDSALNILGGIASALNDRWQQFKDWGKSIGEHLAAGIYDAWDSIKNAASWVANVFKSFLGWFSPPKEGPMSEGDKWMPNMIKTLAQGIVRNLPQIEGAVEQIGEAITGVSANHPVINTGVTAGTEGYASGVAAPALAKPTPREGGLSNQTIINLQPGMMIASKGEVRAFSRMLQQVQNTEGERTGRAI